LVPIKHAPFVAAGGKQEIMDGERRTRRRCRRGSGA
jgi:hypothetical protein